MRRIAVGVAIAVVLSLAVVLVFAATFHPLEIVGTNASISSGPDADPAITPGTTADAPDRQTYVWLELRNVGPFPVRITGVTGDGQNASGYGATGLLGGGDSGRDVVRSEPFTPFTIGPGEFGHVFVVFEPTTDCKLLPSVAPPPDPGSTGAVFGTVGIRFQVLGVISSEQLLDPGNPFGVPHHPTAVCSAG